MFGYMVGCFFGQQIFFKDHTVIGNAAIFAKHWQQLMNMKALDAYTPIGAEMLNIARSISAQSIHSHRLHGAWNGIHQCVESAFAMIRLTTTNAFIAINGPTPLTQISGFSPWRHWVSNQHSSTVDVSFYFSEFPCMSMPN